MREEGINLNGLYYESDGGLSKYYFYDLYLTIDNILKHIYVFALTLLLVLTWEKNLPDETPKVVVRLNFELSYFSTTL